MTQILILGLVAILSLYGIYLSVKFGMWNYFKFLDSYGNLQSALKKFGDFKKKDENQ